MIQVTKINEFSFSIQFDERMKETLSEISGWGSVENFLHSILSDAFLGPFHPEDFYGDLDDDVPF